MSSPHNPLKTTLSYFFVKKISTLSSLFSPFSSFTTFCMDLKSMHGPQSIPSPHPNLTRNPIYLRCNRNHVGNCIQGKQCFICGNIGHMRKKYPKLHGYPSVGFGTERQTIGAVPFPGPSGTSRRPFKTIRPTMIQSSVQQPGAQGKMNVLTQQETWASNVVVEGIACKRGHASWVLFVPGATHSFVSTYLHSIK